MQSAPFVIIDELIAAPHQHLVAGNPVNAGSISQCTIARRFRCVPERQVRGRADWSSPMKISD